MPRIDPIDSILPLRSTIVAFGAPVIADIDDVCIGQRERGVRGAGVPRRAGEMGAGWGYGRRVDGVVVGGGNLIGGRRSCGNVALSRSASVELPRGAENLPAEAK